MTNKRITGPIRASIWILKYLEEATAVEVRGAGDGKLAPGRQIH